MSYCKGTQSKCMYFQAENWYNDSVDYVPFAIYICMDSSLRMCVLFRIIICVFICVLYVYVYFYVYMCLHYVYMYLQEVYMCLQFRDHLGQGYSSVVEHQTRDQKGHRFGDQKGYRS